MKNILEKNRTQRKARYIRAKNAMSKWKECSYGGDFFCNQVYDPQYPWCWVDFRFFHTRLKRYFAASLITAEYNALNTAEEWAWYETDVTFPDSGEHKTEKCQLFSDRMKAYSEETFSIKPSIEICNYGNVAIGVIATVNTSFIDEHYIREFIRFFREDLKEPMTPGCIWEGEEIEVVPAKLQQRYDKR